MHVSFNLATDLDSALKAAAAAAGLEGDGFVPDVRTADPRHGDFQANGVLGYAKARRLNPRAVAEKLVAALSAGTKETCDIAIAGPGFINFTLRPAALLAWLRAYASRETLAAGAAAVSPVRGQTWVVDYSAPNTAKQMHVGHLRSSVIGEAISRLAQFGGAAVVRDNHIGDWGTQFGKIIWAYKRELDTIALARDPLEEFERLYKAGHNAAEADVAVLDEARAELVKLQAGDPENLAIWKKISEVSLGAFQQIYERLGARFDLTLGESFYNDKVDQVYRELSSAGLAVESQGALVVFHPEHPRFREQPFIVRKSDGAANYASTDLATILYRAEQLHATRIVYVVDKRQGDHFEQLFLTARKWFAQTGRTLPGLEHVDFGTVLGENGRPLKTRSGDNIKLKDLLTEAADRAYVLVSEKSPEFPEEERRAIATIVGVGSVQYADLAQNRSSDYVFAWDKMISLEGNTAAYLLYAVARIHSIFRKNQLAPGSAALEAGAGTLETPTELALARKLVKFADALRLATDSLRPHFLCLYLYELAGEFSGFYTADKVIVDDPAVRARRLLLCARTLLVLETGLGLLGLRTLTRM
ncbi:MAG TPA: arginine--tRNA ligase [Opitutaceae bacterium]|nr:arginine--tRNA ligase [Opitutaceae bacterium]